PPDFWNGLPATPTLLSAPAIASGNFRASCRSAFRCA
ncbi:hypothetical protein MYU51_000116, partial [Penicillium brevicompactum]